MINNIVLMGRLTEQPELKTTNTGVSVTSFTVAVERNSKPKDGERVTDFIPVVAWRGTAEFVSRYFAKGQMIAIAGELQTRQYTDKDGNKRKAFEVLANQVSFCGGKNEGNTANSNNAGPNYDDNDIADLCTGDDLPF